MSSTGSSVFEVTQSLGVDDGARIKRLLENGVRIPAQPRVLEELRKLMARSELDVRLLAKVINQDPGLTAMLFKVVGNSIGSTSHSIQSKPFCMRSVSGKLSISCRPSP